MANEAPLSFEAAAFQSYVRGLRRFWREEAYRGTVDAARAEQTADPAEIESRLRLNPAYQLYAWLERYSQRLKYYGRWGIVRWMEQRNELLERVLEEAARRHPERLRLDARLEIPAYVADVDTHQHRGGLWSDACDAFAYETAASGYSFSLFDVQTPMAIYADTARNLAPDAREIVDLGCTVGGSTRSLKRAFPNAKVVGVDVCAPPLRLAHLRALEQKLEIYWYQANAEYLPFESDSKDLVTCHWLFHEMPPNAIRNCLREARRVLRRGGGFMAFDMYLVPGDAIGRWLHAGYAARNNEPFALSFSTMDMKAELEGAGFAGVEMRIAYPEPSQTVREPDLPSERTHYMTMITARAV